jgi:hypothetical protein
MSVTTSGSIKLQIGPETNPKDFILKGTVGSEISVGFRSPPEQPVEIGTIPEIIESVASSLVGKDQAEGFKTRFEDLLKGLGGVPGLNLVIDALKKGLVSITDLAITASSPGEGDSGSYKVNSAAFGFTVAFNPSVALGPIALAGFGVLFEYTPDDEKGRLTTTQQPA